MAKFILETNINLKMKFIVEAEDEEQAKDTLREACDHFWPNPNIYVADVKGDILEIEDVYEET